MVFLTKPKVRFFETEWFLRGGNHYEHQPAEEGKDLTCFTRDILPHLGMKGYLIPAGFKEDVTAPELV